MPRPEHTAFSRDPVSARLSGAGDCPGRNTQSYPSMQSNLSTGWPVSSGPLLPRTPCPVWTSGLGGPACAVLPLCLARLSGAHGCKARLGLRSRLWGRAAGAHGLRRAATAVARGRRPVGEHRTPWACRGEASGSWPAGSSKRSPPVYIIEAGDLLEKPLARISGAHDPDPNFSTGFVDVLRGHGSASVPRPEQFTQFPRLGEI